jgi:hypothetical protein
MSSHFELPALDSVLILGGREGIRTLDLSVANAALSQLSYAPTIAELVSPNIA